MLQRRPDSGTGPEYAPSIVNRALRSHGQPLTSNVRSVMEPRFGRDFSNVRVHTDELAGESARAVDALAYTVGNDIVFGASQYAQNDVSGMRLLAHELTHVVQQSQSPGGPQFSLQVGPVDDPLEQEADKMAEVVAGSHESQESAFTRATSPAPRRIQRAATGKSDADGAGAKADATPSTPAAQGFIVADNAKNVQSGQMHKGEFLNRLETAVCAAADEALAAAGRTAQGCPYIAKWIAHFRGQDSRHVERAIRKYAPESGGVSNAQEYIPFVVARIRRGVTRWVNTGEITEVPEELAGELKKPGLFAVGEQLLSKIGGAVEGAVSAVAGGLKKAASAVASVFTKAQPGGARDAQQPDQIRQQLGAGRPLDSGVRSRMETAFGENFAGVQVHTGQQAGRLSTEMNARAFTLGKDMAFAAGEYRPGTLVGDALIAHELAHVTQQRGEDTSAGVLTKGGSEYNALEEDADTAAAEAVTSMWFGGQGKLAKLRGHAMPRLKSGLRLQRCGGPDRKLNISTWTKKQKKDFITKNFTEKDRSVAESILQDMLESNELTFVDEESLKDEIFKRLRTSQIMQETQNLYGVAFEYPEHGKHCIPNNKAGKKYPRVNKAAEAYWGPVQYSSGSTYYFELTDAGKNNAYKALTSLFTPQRTGDKQKDICNMTLIHCDYLASVVHFRAFADDIGVPEFNRRVKNGDIEMRLAWNGFRELEDVGWFHSKKSISLREVRPASPKELVIGDHVIFFNHRAYDLINEKVHNEWRLENAILIYRRGKEDYFLGHGSGAPHTNLSMLSTLANRYNIVAKEALDTIDNTKSSDAKKAAAAKTKMDDKFPNIKPRPNGKWNIVGNSWGKDFDEPVRKLDEDHPEKEKDLPGLRDPDDPSKMGCVKRPSEAPGESC